LSPEDQKYYDNYFDLFSTDGWKQFIAEVQEIHDAYRIEDIKDERHLAFIKGERDALRRVLRFEFGMKHTYDNLMDKADA